MAEEDNKSIKEQADMQRQKTAPQPRERKETPDTNVLEDINNKLGISMNIDRNNVSIQAQILRTNTSGFLALSESLSKLTSEMVEKSSLKDLEDKREAASRAEETNDLLGEIVGNLKENKVAKLSKGFFSILVGAVGAVIGTIAGLSAGIITGFFERLFFTFDKDGKKNLRLPFQKIIDLVVDLFQSLKKFIKPRALGFALGLSMQLDMFLDSITKPLKNLRGTAATKVSAVGARITQLFDAVVDGIRAAIKFVTSSKGFIKAGSLTAFILGGFKTFGTGIFNFAMEIPRAIFALVGDLADPVRKIAEAFAGKIPKPQQGLFGTQLKSLGKVPGLVKGVGKTLATVLNPFFTLFKTTKDAFFRFGKVLGRFFLPLTIIFGIIDTVKGIFGGLEDTAKGESKLISGLFGGIKGFLVGFVGLPLDMLKSAISWLSEKILGEGNFISRILDNFSFENLFGSLVDGVESVFQFIFGAINGLINGIISLPEKIGNFMASLPTMGELISKIPELFKALLRSVLPDPSKGLLSIAGLASRAIPDGIYEFAGMDPETGALTSAVDQNNMINQDRNLQLEAKRMAQGNTQNQIVTDASRRSVQNISIVNDSSGSATTAALSDSFG